PFVLFLFYSPSFLSFFYFRHGALPVLHSFPTRRSSDLVCSAPDNSSALTLFASSCWVNVAQVVAKSCSCLVSPAWECFHSARRLDRKSTRLNSSHVSISYAVFCLKKKKKIILYSIHLAI